MKANIRIGVLGAGLAGCCAALNLAGKGFDVTLIDREFLPMNCASVHNEGKLHLGYVYALDKERRTHQKMTEGSLWFLDIIETLTGINKSRFERSTSFNYGIPKATMLPLENIVEHFMEVDQGIKRVIKESGRDHLEKEFTSSKLLRNVPEFHYSKDDLYGVIQTPEFSVNPIQIANAISTSVLLNKNIRFINNANIEEVRCTGSNGYQVTFRKDDLAHEESFDACINCLWEERVVFDKMMGIDPPKSQLTRYKATITFFDRGKDFMEIPSTTLIVGAFGDVVNYGNGSFYLSWYPSCKIGEAKGPDLRNVKQKISSINRENIISESIRSLAQYVPTVENFMEIRSKGRIGGGFICAWAQTDIADIESGLHSRSDIGVEMKDRWISVNTGKYCTAPLYGVRAANDLISIL